MLPQLWQAAAWCWVCGKHRGRGCQAVGGAEMPQGRFQRLCSRGSYAKMPFEFPCDPLIERGRMSSGRSQSQRLCNSVSMRVQAPPSRCRSASVSPGSATGPQWPEAGIKSGAWKPHSGYPVEQASMGSVSEGVLSHRENEPAQEADALEPKWHRIRRRQPEILTGEHCRETRWKAPPYGCEQ